MKQLAEQELKLLEAQYPTRFQHLKLDLKAFINLLDDEEEEEQQQSFKRKQQHFQLSILTEESSSRKQGKIKRGRREKEEEEEGISGAIQKAEACLQKIQTLKSLFRSCNG